jgi:hypothetical protein
LVLALHLGVSIGWFGAIAAYLPFDIVATTSAEPGSLRSAYHSMDLIASTVLVPLAVATLVTGVVIALGTSWGLFRHWWVVISLVLTTVATLVLLVETRTIAAHAAVAASPSASIEDLRVLGGTLPHSIGGMAVLALVLVLNVYKPRGLTRYGWQKRRAELAGQPGLRPDR